MNLENRVHFVRKDVTFHENVFPFKESLYNSEQPFLDVPVVPRKEVMEDAPPHVEVLSSLLVHIHTEQGVEGWCRRIQAVVLFLFTLSNKLMGWCMSMFLP